MRIAIILLGRTVPGFNDLIDSIASKFNAEITTGMMDFPMTRSFRAQRKQYDAEFFLKELYPFGQPDKTLFITREDLFAGNLNFVFGIAAADACIVSTARLDPRFYDESVGEDARQIFITRLIKESVHELGHTLGLPHCSDRRCVMAFSNSIGDVDGKERDLCERCTKALYLSSE